MKIDCDITVEIMEESFYLCGFCKGTLPVRYQKSTISAGIGTKSNTFLYLHEVLENVIIIISLVHG